MGSASSKPARKLARTPPAWAGARSPSHGEHLPHAHSRLEPLASETKNEAIERDAKDPQLLANLSKLGPVTVDHHMQSVRPAAVAAQHLFQTRLRSEDEARASRPTPNRLVAFTLNELLEERKFATTQHDIEMLAKKYDVDPEKLERLAHHVNSVSVDQSTVRRWVNDDGAENVTMLASWVKPRIEEQTPRMGSVH